MSSIHELFKRRDLLEEIKDLLADHPDECIEVLEDYINKLNKQIAAEEKHYWDNFRLGMD